MPAKKADPLSSLSRICRTGVGESVIYDPSERLASAQPSIKLTLESTTPLPKTSSILSTLTLAPASSDKVSIPPMTVHHYLYEGWPDFGVPRGKDVEKLQELIAEVGRKQKEEAAGGCEVWVHWYVPLSAISLLANDPRLIPTHDHQLGGCGSYRYLHRSFIAPQQTNVPFKRLFKTSAIQITYRASAGILTERSYRLTCRSFAGTEGSHVPVGCSGQVVIRAVYGKGTGKAVNNIA